MREQLFTGSHEGKGSGTERTEQLFPLRPPLDGDADLALRISPATPPAERLINNPIRGSVSHREIVVVQGQRGANTQKEKRRNHCFIEAKKTPGKTGSCENSALNLQRGKRDRLWAPALPRSPGRWHYVSHPARVTPCCPEH